uniref:phenylalanine--tRNA ligase n=1 Tax=Ignisphaera aggregans TaxID=334771 RepID=A0A7J3MWW2_9CREN
MRVMPVVRTSLSRMLRLIGINDIEKLRDTLFNLKCETEVDEDGTIAIEVQSDRIDMFSVEGIAYAARLYLGLTIPKSIDSKSFFRVFVEPPLRRPYIGIAAVKNVELDEEALKDLIEFQERLHITYGRHRRKIAIGLHDLSRVSSNTIVYKDVDIDRVEMVPLFSERRISIREVLNSTEQGSLYGSIAIHGNMHPAIIVSDEVISLPPVINSDITRLEPSSRDILIDVTGTDFNSVINVLNVIVHALSFYGGEVLGAEIYYPDRTTVTPDLKWREIEIDINFVARWLGLEVRKVIEESNKALQKMGYMFKEITNEKMSVLVPPYRCDIMHPVDVVEDIAIGFRYNNLGIELVEPVKSVKLRVMRKIDVKSLAEVLSEVLVGLGYTEVNVLSLSSSKTIELVSDEPYLKIMNALSKELDALRNSLIPSMLTVLRDSQYVAQPVKIFEIGEVVEKCDTCYTGWRNSLNVLLAVMDSEIRFEDIHADLYAVLRELGLEGNLTIRACRKKTFIDGRCGCILYGDKEVGVIGEVHPEILKSMGIEYPIAMAELKLDTLAKVIRGLK